MIRFLKPLIVIALFGIVVAPGCGKPKAKLVPANGIVLIDGQPAGGIMVQCSPITMDQNLVAPTSQALTGDDGKFVLMTLDNEPGAFPGKHRVSLYDTLEERPAQGQEQTVTSRLDGKFTSGAIEIEVVEGQEIKIEATGPK